MKQGLLVVGLLLTVAGPLRLVVESATAPTVLLSFHDAVVRSQYANAPGQGIEALAGDTRLALIQHPPSRIEWAVTLPEGRHHLSVGLGLMEAAWNRSDGVQFRATVVDRGRQQTLLDRTVDPGSVQEHQGWVDTRQSFVTTGSEVVLAFETLAGTTGDGTMDWAVWGDAKIDTQPRLHWMPGIVAGLLLVAFGLSSRAARSAARTWAGVWPGRLALSLGGTELLLRVYPGLVPVGALSHIPLDAQESLGALFQESVPDDELGFLGRPRECVRYRRERLFNEVYPQDGWHRVDSPDRAWQRWRMYWWDFDSLPSGAFVAADDVEVEVCTDDDGFRNPTDLAGPRAVVVGDSFVQAGTVNHDQMWTSVLSRSARITVRNLGMPGYAPQQSATVLDRFGPTTSETLPIFAYYEGNDIAEAETFERYRDSGVSWHRFQTLTQRSNTGSLTVRPYSGLFTVAAGKDLLSRLTPRTNAASVRHTTDSLNPVCGPVGGKELCLAFERWTTARAGRSMDEWTSAPGWSPTQNAMRAMRQRALQVGARLVVVLIPSKVAVYLPLLAGAYTPEDLGRFVGAVDPDSARSPLEEAGLVLGNIRNQRTMVRTFLESEGIAVIDLLDPFVTEAGKGRMLYHAFDTHWNDAGNRLKRFSDSPCTAWARRGTSACTNAGGPMQAYSMDLRERALLDSDAGMKAADVAVKYRVSGSWVRLLKQRRRETGEVAPRVQRHGRRRMLEPHLHTLAALIAEQPDRTLAELKDALGTPASLATIWRAVAALDVTVKKNGPALRTRST